MAVRLTAAQALVRFLGRQFIDIDDAEVPYFAGVWAIFGHARRRPSETGGRARHLAHVPRP